LFLQTFDAFNLVNFPFYKFVKQSAGLRALKPTLCSHH